VMVAARVVSRKQASSTDLSAGLRLNKPLNWLFRKIMAVEFIFIRYGVNFTLGGSRLLIARKKRR